MNGKKTIKKKEQRPLLKKSLGQHFLRTSFFPRRIAQSLPDTVAWDTLLEIGPGSGMLTRELVACWGETKTIVAVEKDEKWKREIERLFPSLSVIHGDIVTFPLQKEARYCVVGNIPYYITHHIFDWILSGNSVIPCVTLMVQNEVAEKIAKKRGKNYGVYSVLFQNIYEVTLLDVVPREAFFPMPKVTSRIIQCVKRDERILFEQRRIDDFKKFLFALFHFPRKKIKNNVDKDFFSRYPAVIPFEEKRAQEISPEELFSLWHSAQ